MLFVLSIFILVTSGLCDERIVGGDDVTHSTRAPWQASLQVGGSHFCGGSLISATKVMTACHCKQSSLTVVVGTLDYNKPGQSFVTSDFLCHSSYSSSTIDYDYAIITISAAKLSDSVRPVAVADKEYPAGTQAMMTGWGRLSGGGPIPDKLQYAYTFLISEADCQKVWGSMVTDRMQCANNLDNSACNGDSGGPLVVKEGTDWALVGNTSWGVNGCATNYPSAWSKNVAVYSWIQSNL